MTLGGLRCAVLATPVGPLSVVTDPDGVLLASGYTPDPAPLLARLAAAGQPAAGLPVGPGARPPSVVLERLAAFHAGELGALDDLAVRQPGGAGPQRVWAALRAIPPGETRTYTELAAAAGLAGAPRAAGAACARNLVAPVVPCHRAVRRGGGLAGYAYGVHVKAWLLRHEGAGLPRT